MEVCKGPLRRRPAAGGIAHATQRMLNLSDRTGVRSDTKECWFELGETTGLDRQLEGTATGRKWAEVGVDLVRSIFQRAWHIKPFVDDDDFWMDSKSRGEVTEQIPQHPLARSLYDLWLPSLVAPRDRGGRTRMTLGRLHRPADQPLVLSWCASPALVCPAAPVLSCS